MSVVSSGEQNSRPKLKRSLGLSMATALVIGNMVGSGVFGLPSALAGVGPISLLAWGFTGIGAILLALVFANLGRAYPQTGGPYAYTRRAFGDFAGLLDGLGLLDRRLGRQRRNRGHLRQLRDRVLAEPRHQQRPRVRGRALGDLAAHARERRGRTRVRRGPARHDGAQVRAAAADRRDRPLLHEQRQLHAVRPEPRLARRPLARDLVRGHAHAVGVPGPRVGHGAGRGGQGPGAHAAARHHVRHARHDRALRDRHRRDHGRHPRGDAGELERAVRRRGPADLRLLGARHVARPRSSRPSR